eukprot:gnl/TRDRNA2_/TRDRNA2_142655_c2_seq2.p1 gnl/TRDRNA2_/TRDRNA2_142655_c2~~gnl/TRDRNA2_/TRDRNA2_142655_c2_seq2.p1  ORF type:complete len:218 (+),score=69.64 gnl/TRDRNA2_/TRDRNA2_142655_c2_seq2:76-654(+)
MARLDTLQSQQEVSAKSEQQELHKLRAEMKQVERGRLDEESRGGALRAEVERLSLACATLEGDLFTAKEDDKTLRQENSVLQDAVRENKEKLATLKKELREREGFIERLIADIEAAQTRGGSDRASLLSERELSESLSEDEDDEEPDDQEDEADDVLEATRQATQQTEGRSQEKEEKEEASEGWSWTGRLWG